MSLAFLLLQRSPAGLGRLLIVLGSTLIWQTALGDWAETRQAGGFQLRSEFSLSDSQSRQLLQEIANLQGDIEHLLKLTAKSDPVEVNLFRTKASYQAHLKVRVPNASDRPALFVKGPDMSRVYVYRRWGFEQDVRHECTHAVLHGVLPYVPLWLDEGLAEYFEVSPAQRSSGHVHLRDLKRRILFGWQPNLRRLERLESINQMGADEYRESWAWAHFLLHGPAEARQLLSDYLFDIQSGELAGLFSDRLSARIPDVDQQLIKHLREWR